MRQQLLQCIVENYLKISIPNCRSDIIISKINAISSVIATENWVIKTTPYTVHLAHQSDTALIAVKVSVASL